VAGGEDAGDDGASVGEEVVDGNETEVRSKSRSGIGGDSNGRRVVRRRSRRRRVLLKAKHYKLFMTRVLLQDALDDLNEHNAPHSELGGDLASQTHLDNKLGKSNYFQASSSPFI